MRSVAFSFSFPCRCPIPYGCRPVVPRAPLCPRSRPRLRLPPPPPGQGTEALITSLGRASEGYFQASQASSPCSHLFETIGWPCQGSSGERLKWAEELVQNPERKVRNTTFTNARTAQTAAVPFTTNRPGHLALHGTDKVTLSSCPNGVKIRQHAQRDVHDLAREIGVEVQRL